MNAIAVIDKPAGLTSHDVVSRLRRVYNIRRVGHSGTLDPIATGVLPVFLGRATRASEFAMAGDKTYLARLRLGITTDTQDITGEITSECDVRCGLAEVENATRGFIGEILQTPPMYSAVKVNGQKLYELARKGIEVKREPRKIKIYDIRVERVDEVRFDMTVTCSKGTYIRTLCADIGRALGCGGTMEALRRLKSGRFDISQSRTLEQVEKDPFNGLISVDYLFSEYPRVVLKPELEKKCRNGAPVIFDVKPDEKYRVYAENGEFLMLARGAICRDRSCLVTIKSFFNIMPTE